MTKTKNVRTFSAAKRYGPYVPFSLAFVISNATIGLRISGLGWGDSPLERPQPVKISNRQQVMKMCLQSGMMRTPKDEIRIEVQFSFWMTIPGCLAGISGRAPGSRARDLYFRIFTLLADFIV
ncbi:hypothetical protein [Stieleria mannarensis]|uniref:hypothetical protein n=1 Tax=Stieleria mannarensis TaxID=2755585 RepID=UPI0016043A96|nr:hypothetical protein [Rhodopirellula sp. JC639]